MEVDASKSIEVMSIRLQELKMESGFNWRGLNRFQSLFDRS